MVVGSISLNREGAVMYLQSDAENAKNAVLAFHTHHSKMTFNPGVPGIAPWLRDTLVSLQHTLQVMAETQIKIAKQTDQNTEVLRQVTRYLENQQRAGK